MDERLLTWVMTRTAALGAAVTLASAFLMTRQVAVGVGFGAALAVGNLWVLIKLGRRMVAGPARQRKAATVIFAGKFVLLVGVVLLVMRSVDLDVLALAGGFSTVVLVIVFGALLGPAPTTNNEAGDEASLSVKEQ